MSCMGQVFCLLAFMAAACGAPPALPNAPAPAAVAAPVAVAEPVAPAAVAAPEPRPADALIWEDFSNVADGLLPANWSGSDEIVVGPLRRSKAMFISSGDGAGSVVVPLEGRPIGNFSLRLMVTMDKYCGKSALDISLGAVRVGFECSDIWNERAFFDDDRKELEDVDAGHGRLTTLELARVGDVFVFTVNGRREFLKRLPGFEVPASVTIGLSGGRGGPLVHRVHIRALPGEVPPAPRAWDGQPAPVAGTGAP
jgi:hypothetical protein